MDVAAAYPLRAVCILIQAQEDRLVTCNQGEAAVYLSGSAHQVIRNQEAEMNTDLKRWMKDMMFSSAYRMTKEVPCFLLYATLTGRFLEKIEQNVTMGNPGLNN